MRQNLRTVGGITTPRPRRGGLSDHELAFIRKLALELCRLDGGIVRETPIGIIDHMLRRGAILHGDAAMMALPDPETGAGPRTFVAIFDEFRFRYLLSYTPTNVDQDGWHELEVRVKRRGAAVTAARPGYFR